MRVLFDSMAGANSAEAEDERLLQQAIEMSKGESGQNASGLTSEQIKRIAERAWSYNSDQTECLVCFENFERFQKIKVLGGCDHQFHSPCLDSWLQDDKRCPTCQMEVNI